MKSMKCRVIAMLMITVMIFSQLSIPVAAAAVDNETDIAEETVDTVSGTEITSDDAVEEKQSEKSEKGDIISVNTGMGIYDVCENPEEGGAGFEADGSYTIQIPEKNPFFPYEVQFTHNGTVTTEWFMTPDSQIEIGGHTFRVNADFDGSVITQMSLKVAGQEVVIYPERKNFSNDVLEEESLLPLPTPDAGELGSYSEPLKVDLTKYTPVEMTNVSMASVFAGKVALSDTDKIAWTWSGDQYTVSTPGDHINLSRLSRNSNYTDWTMIAGNDQLNGSNMKYRVRVEYSDNAYKWLVPTVYAQDADGNRTEIEVNSYNYHTYKVPSSYGDNSTYGEEWVYIPEDIYDLHEDIYYSFSINTAFNANKQYDHMKIYEGRYNSAQEAASGIDITDKILDIDMSHKEAGYSIGYSGSEYSFEKPYFTVVAFDAANNPTGCQYFELRTTTTNTSVTYDYDEINAELFTSQDYQVTATRSYGYNYDELGNVIETENHLLYKKFPVNAIYYCKMSYKQKGALLNDPLSKVTAAYVGRYSSIAEAQEAGAKDIKENLFGTKGYPADYSQGIQFTVFAGEEIFYKSIRTKEGYKSADTRVWFEGLKDRNGNEISCYQAGASNDSYGEHNYLAYLVKPDVDITQLAPIFSIPDNDDGEKIRLYASGSDVPEKSGESYHDFSQGPIQYSASAENGINFKNYWLSVIKAVNGRGQLYITSTAAKESNTRIENGIIYSDREVILENLSEYHDIFVMNTGTEAFPAMSAELESDVLYLDDYWDFKGQYELAGVDIDNLGDDNYTKNIAKLRLRVKDGVDSGAEISGTLTIKSNGTTLAVLTLTGMAGNPYITTEEIPAAVKYVPYGTMIQNSNKYSKNIITYEMTYGTLPEGMELRPNGEIYGVPKETGEFEIGVRIICSYNDFVSGTEYFTLIVNDNTDPNVDGATDEGYTVLQRVPNITMDDPNSYTFVSEGTYGEYKAVYLDGEKLVEGVDYTSESGSTRITLRSQTLVSSNTEGAHTIGVEFRSSSDDSLKRAAQNYRIIPGSVNDRVGGGAAGSGSSINMAPIRYTVKPGDTLWKIARQFYGNGAMWTKIYADNKSTIKNPNRIYVGQVLLIYPSIGDGTYITESGSKTYTVKSGDTLWSIAERMYGKGKRWKKIYEANKGTLSDPNKLYAGQILIIPN